MSNREEAFSAIETVRRSLGVLFESVNSADSAGDHLLTGLDMVIHAIGELGDPAQLQATVEPEERELLAQKLAEVQRLMAILSEATQRKSEDTSKLLNRANLARKHLNTLVFVEGRGKTCDLSG